MRLRFTNKKLKKIFDLKFLRIRILPVTILLIFFAPAVLLFQNASSSTPYDPASLYNYYQSQLSLCLGTDHRNCPGEVTELTYAYSPWWGLSPGCSKAKSGSSGEGCGFTAPVFDREVSQKVVYKGTGVYVTKTSGFDAYMNPSTDEEYSYAYNGSASANVSGPARTTTRTYYYNFNPLPSDAEGRTYNIVGFPMATTVSGIGTTTNNYLSTGKVSSTVEYGIEKDYAYDASGNLYTQTEYRNGTPMVTATYTNYVDGIAQTITRPLGATTYKVVNPDGTTASDTDALGNKTSYEYDQNFRISQITRPINLPTTISWPNELTKIETRGNLQKTTYYDVLGRVDQVAAEDLSTKNFIVSITNYDEDGRVSYKSLPGWNAPSPYGTQFYYDILDRKTKTVQTGNNAMTTFSYQAPDETVIKTPTGYTQNYFYLNYGNPDENQLIQSSLPTSANNTVVTTMARDPLGKLLEATQNGVSREYQYNANQLLSEIHEPEKADTYFTYYGGSKLLYQKQIGTSAPITYTYDALDRMWTAKFSNTADNITYNYDYASHVLSTVTDTATTSFKYDANGNKTKEAITIDGINLETDFYYNTLDQNYSIRYPSTASFVKGASVPQNTVTYGLDALNHETSLVDLASTIISSATYNPNGLFETLAYGNKATASLSLTATQWPYVLGINAGGTKISLAYSYDPLGNVLGIADTVNSDYTQSFLYDGMNRMTFASHPNGASLVPAGHSANLGGNIGYTNTGDITSYTEFAKASTTLNYDPVTQRLASSSGPVSRTYSYDSYGQMSSNSQYKFYYDPNFNMTSVTNASTGTGVATYTYDAADERIKKVLANGQTTYYLYNGGKIAFEGSPTKGTKEYFYLGSDLVGTRALSPSGAATYQYYHFNPVLSTIAISNASGAIAAQEHYNSYGAELVPNATFTSDTDVRFAGQISDDEDNLIYMKGRYYDPHIARFITPDPKDFDQKNLQSFNKYVYANNNPLKFVDPSGQSSEYAMPTYMESFNEEANKPWIGGMSKGDALIALMSILPQTRALAATVKVVGAAKGVDAAAKSSSNEMVTVFRGRNKQGLTRMEPAPPGQTRLERDIKNAGLDYSQVHPDTQKRVDWERGKMGVFLNKEDARIYAEPNGSVYEGQVPKSSLHPASERPRSPEVIEGDADHKEFFTDESFFDVIQEHKMTSGSFFNQGPHQGGGP